MEEDSGFSVWITEATFKWFLQHSPADPVPPAIAEQLHLSENTLLVELVTPLINAMIHMAEMVPGHFAVDAIEIFHRPLHFEDNPECRHTGTYRYKAVGFVNDRKVKAVVDALD